jgi:hypothetical protein
MPVGVTCAGKVLPTWSALSAMLSSIVTGMSVPAGILTWPLSVQARQIARGPIAPTCSPDRGGGRAGARVSWLRDVRVVPGQVGGIQATVSGEDVGRSGGPAADDGHVIHVST